MARLSNGMMRHVLLAAAVTCLATGTPPLAWAAADDAARLGSAAQPISLQPSDVAASWTLVEPPGQRSTRRTVALAPARTVLQVAPGRRYAVTLRVDNRTANSVALRPGAIDLVAASTEDALAVPAPAERRPDASSWLELPPAPGRALDSGARAEIVIGIAVPGGATPGVHAAAFVLSRTLLAPGAGGSRVRADAQLAAQFLLVVPGSARSALDLSEVEAPRVAWPGDRPKYRVRVRNSGQTLASVGGEVQLSGLASIAARDLRLGRATLLPDGSRDLSVQWDDRPLAGWFHPRLEVEDEASGVTVRRSLPTVYVLPPWWLIAALLATLTVPLVARRRRRRRR